LDYGEHRREPCKDKKFDPVNTQGRLRILSTSPWANFPTAVGSGQLLQVCQRLPGCVDSIYQSVQSASLAVDLVKKVYTAIQDLSQRFMTTLATNQAALEKRLDDIAAKLDKLAGRLDD